MAKVRFVWSVYCAPNCLTFLTNGPGVANGDNCALLSSNSSTGLGRIAVRLITNNIFPFWDIAPGLIVNDSN